MNAFFILSSTERESLDFVYLFIFISFLKKERKIPIRLRFSHDFLYDFMFPFSVDSFPMARYSQIKEKLSITHL